MKTNMLGLMEENEGITIKEAAKIANVSIATIRNWIKTGYLIKNDDGTITNESLNNFLQNVAGKEKLNSRSNKSLKDKHNYEEISNNINELINNFNNDEIGTKYENSLSNSYRNKEGIYYTPSWIIKDLFKDIPITPELKFLDPCCGSGNFIIEAIKLGIKPENVYGFDTDKNAVLITKHRIKEEFGYNSENIKVGDFLQEAITLKQNNIFFDLIFTNPPWGKKIEKNIREHYAKIYECGKSLDTTSLFLGASLAILKPNGYLGFLNQEAFFNVSAFEDIRRKIMSKKILRLIDYGKAFNGLLTKAQGIVIINQQSNWNDKIECSISNQIFNRTLKSFTENPKAIFNFWTNENEAQVISHLYSLPHITLQNRAIWAMGIVTGNNNKYCSHEPKEGYIPIYRGSDITKNGIKEPSLFIINDFSKFQQVAPLHLYQAKEKIIYRFISSDLCFYYDTQQRYILNSANLLIPTNIEITPQQLTMLLNSNIINWLFKKLFATHKILRGDLELLPIHVDYFKYKSEFTENDYLEYLQVKKTDNGSYVLKQ